MSNSRGFTIAMMLLFASGLAPDLAGGEQGSPDPESSYFLLARDGQQCVLQDEGERIAAAERDRLEAIDIEITGSWVAFLLREDVLPKGCVPDDPDQFFSDHPLAASGVKSSGGAVCEACGCPETWFFCVASQSDSDLLEGQGYALVEKDDDDSRR